MPHRSESAPHHAFLVGVAQISPGDDGEVAAWARRNETGAAVNPEAVSGK